MLPTLLKVLLPCFKDEEPEREKDEVTCPRPSSESCVGDAECRLGRAQEKGCPFQYLE